MVFAASSAKDPKLLKSVKHTHGRSLQALAATKLLYVLESLNGPAGPTEGEEKTQGDVNH